MGYHIPLKNLLAYQERQLSAAASHDIKLHLDTCSLCAENLKWSTAVLTKLSTARLSDRPKLAGACYAPDIISQFISRELTSETHEKVESHLADCADCRQQLSEIFRAGIEPVTDAEKELLKALPPFEIAEQAQKIMALMPPAPPPPAKLRDRIVGFFFPQVPEMTKSRRAPKFAFAQKLAATGVLLGLIVAFGYQPFRGWQAQHHVEAAMARLMQVWKINDAALRPAAEFGSSMRSIIHSPTTMPGIDTIRAEFHEAVEWKAGHRSVRLGLAIYWYFAENMTRADSLLDELLQENPRDAAAWNQRGLMAAHREDSTAALAAFARALQIEPNDVYATFNRATLLYHLGRRDEAIQAWQKYLTLDRNSKWAEIAERRLRVLKKALQKN